MSKFIACLTATVLAGSALLAPLQAQAYDQGVQGNSTAFCQAALPVFDTYLRKRPLAVVNEGSTTTYVTCSYPVGSTAYQISIVYAYFANHSGITKDVNCTLVDGKDNGVVTYYPKTTRSYDDGHKWAVGWNMNADNGGIGFGSTLSISCALPAAIGLADQYVYPNGY